MQTCQDCKFFVPSDVDEPFGLCHAEPPRVVCCGNEVDDVRPTVRVYDIACRFFRYAKPKDDITEYVVSEFPY